MPETFRIGVIGAGIAGLACARRLSARGAKVTVFEQHRRPGGRAATQPTAVGSFDYGAPFFTVQSQTFDNIVAPWEKAGTVERWNGRVVGVVGAGVVDRTDAVARYVGTDGMQSLARHLCRDLELRLDLRIDRVARRGASWTLADEGGRTPAPGGFDALVVAVPAPSAVALLAESPPLLRRAAAVTFDPRWVALLALESASGFDFAFAEVDDHEILAAALRHVGKGNAGVERWVLHANVRWTRSNLNIAADDAASKIAQAFAERFNFGFRPSLLVGHRWLLAAPANPLSERFLWDAERGIGAAGDWCCGTRIEDAVLSGYALASAITAG